MDRWRPNDRVTYSKWFDCDVCGLPWPEKELRMQNGALRCPECFDDKSHEDYVAEREAPEEQEDIVPGWEVDS